MPGPEASRSAETSVTSSRVGAQIDTTDSEWARWKNWGNYKFGRMSAETQAEFIRKYDDYSEESDIKRCEKHRDYLLKYSRPLLAAR